MNIISELSQLLLVVVLAINVALAFLVYRGSSRSATNVLFALLSIATSIWLIMIYSATSPADAEALTYTRLTVFFAVPQSVLFFLLAYTLPSNVLPIKKRSLLSIAAATILMMAFTLSPYVFSEVVVEGGDVRSIPGLGMPLFALFTAGFSVGAIYVLTRKISKAIGETKSQLRLMMTGILLMLGLIIATIMLPIMLFQNQMFIPLAPLYALIFLALTAYAIVKYQLFNVKVLATEALTTVLWVALFAKGVTAEGLAERVTDFLIFATALFFGILLIRSVRKEVEQREIMEGLTQQLQAANTQLTELSRFKTQLLSLASHQLKSPLAVIKGFASLLMQDMYGPLDAKVKEVVAKMKASADQLISLVNTLLDLRRVEEGRMEYQFATVDLSAMLETVVQGLQPLAADKKLALKWAKPSREIFISADLRTLPEVFRNLIDNAIKYTPQGEVAVTVAAENGKAVVSVKDSGIGVSAELLPKLFEEFVRDERIRKEIQGTGFGLYIARKIVEAHGGKISATSPGQGKGSTFSVMLPLLDVPHS